MFNELCPGRHRESDAKGATRTLSLGLCRSVGRAIEPAPTSRGLKLSDPSQKLRKCQENLGFCVPQVELYMKGWKHDPTEYYMSHSIVRDEVSKSSLSYDLYRLYHFGTHSRATAWYTHSASGEWWVCVKRESHLQMKTRVRKYSYYDCNYYFIHCACLGPLSQSSRVPRRLPF